MAETGLAMRALPFMICPECIELLGSWARASDRLCQQTALLSATAVSGDQFGYDQTVTLVEDIRLQAENARTAYELHKSRCQSLVPAVLRH